MLLTTNNTDCPQRLYDTHNIIQSLDLYFKDHSGSSFTGLIQELEDNKGLLIVTVYKNLYDKLAQNEKDNFQQRIENIWTKLYHLDDLKILGNDETVIYKSWERSPRAR